MSRPIPTAVALLHTDHFPRQQKPTEINTLSYLDFLGNHTISEHVACTE